MPGFFRISFSENSQTFTRKFKLKLSVFYTWTLRAKKYSLGDIFCELKSKKKGGGVLEKKRQKRTSQFFFFKNNETEWKFLDFPSLSEIPGNVPFFSRVIQFLALFPVFPVA